MSIATGTTKKPPRMDITKGIPPMVVGMSADGAYKNGYRHGYEGYNTPHICSLTKGTPERNAWFHGYYDGLGDAGGD